MDHDMKAQSLLGHLPMLFHEDARLRVILRDGRNLLLAAERQTYDVIISQPSNPWIAGGEGLAALFSGSVSSPQR